MKALKRRAGAHAVTLDTIDGIASYSLLASRKIDFKELEKACKSASYQLVEVKLEAKGEVVSIAGKDGRYLKIRGTGQLFRISGDYALGKVEGLVGEITGRDGSEVRFKPVKPVKTIELLPGN